LEPHQVGEFRRAFDAEHFELAARGDSAQVIEVGQAGVLDERFLPLLSLIVLQRPVKGVGDEGA